jgi:hypothetical protein
MLQVREVRGTGKAGKGRGARVAAVGVGEKKKPLRMRGLLSNLRLWSYFFLEAAFFGAAFLAAFFGAAFLAAFLGAAFLAAFLGAAFLAAFFAVAILF